MPSISSEFEWIEKGTSESDIGKAIECFNEALSLNPNNQEALYHKGIFLIQLKEYQKAYWVFKHLTNLNKKHSEAWYSMGLISEICDDEIPASKFYRKAIKLDPENIDALYGLLRVSKKDIHKISCLQKMTKTMPENVNIWIQLIELNIKASEFSSTRKNIISASFHHPKNKKLLELNEKLEKIKTQTEMQEKANLPYKTITAIPEEEYKGPVPDSYYNEWEPPAPVTVYCKLHGISYSSYKYYRTRSSSDIQIRVIEDKLGSREYNCGCCSSYLDELCSYKRGYVWKNAICKHFEPRKEPHIKSYHPINEKITLHKTNGAITCPYCNKKAKSEKGIKAHLESKHPHKVAKHF